jgi:hypothetical protein
MMRLSPLALALGLCTLAGCGNPNPPTGRVTGKVTWQGQPVKNASVIFAPVTGDKAKESPKGANGRTNDGGEYTLNTFGEGDGAVLGKHRVLVSIDDANHPYTSLPPAERIYEVKESGNQIDIELDPNHKK